MKPIIRFPQFSGAWKFEKGKNIFENRKEKSNQSYPIFSVTLDRGLVPRGSMARIMKNDAKTEENLIARPNDIVYNMMRMWQGAMGIAKQICLISPAYVVLTPKENVLSEFYLTILKTKKYLNRLEAYSYGLTNDRLRLYYKDFGLMDLPFTSMQEQKKITAFLSAIDNKIQLLTQKKSFLEQYKKGCMQQIFSQALRFKDSKYQDYPEWMEKKLGNVSISIKAGKTKPGSNGSFPVFGSTGKLGVAEEFSYEGPHILIARVGANAGKLNYVSGQFSVTDNTLVLKFDNRNNIKFFYYLLHNSNLNKLVFGSGQPLITGTLLTNIKINIPCYQEQQKIADFLSAIDIKINLVSTQLEKTREYKKGLLQQMFV